MIEIDKDILDKLRNALPADGSMIIKEKTGLSRKHIDNVLAGRRYNLNVIKAAIEVAKETKEKNESLRKEIIDLVQ